MLYTNETGETIGIGRATQIGRYTVLVSRGLVTPIEMKSVLGEENFAAFKRWMNGKTMLGGNYFVQDVRNYLTR